MSFGVERRPWSASERNASRRSSAVRCTSTRGADVVSLVMGVSSLWLRVRREAYASEHPTTTGWKEIAIGAANVRSRRDARAASQHHLPAHELAVVLTDGAGRGREAGIGKVGARRPLPNVSE